MFNKKQNVTIVIRKTKKTLLNFPFEGNLK